VLKYDILSHLLLIPYMVRVSRKFKCRKDESLHVVKNYLKSDNYNKFQVLKYDILSHLLLMPYMVRVSRKFKCLKVKSHHVVKTI
jgi:hypothetical protein